MLIATPSFEHSPHPEAGQEMLAGLSDETFDNCFADEAAMNRILERQKEASERHAIAATPSASRTPGNGRLSSAMWAR